MHFDPILPQQEPEPPQPEQPKKPGCLFRAVVGFVVLALLASSLFSIAWFVRRDIESEPQAADFPTPTAEPAQNVEQEQDPVLESEPTVDPKVTSEPELQSSALASSEDTINRIVIVNSVGNIETITPEGTDRWSLDGEEFTYQFPTWSPDGSRIAVLGNSDEGSGILLLEDQMTESEPHELVFSQSRNPFYLYWSPDSSEISYLAAERGSELSLNIVGTNDDPQSRMIASGSPFYWNWSDDSNDLLIHSGRGSEEARLGLIDNDGQDQSPEINSPGFFQAPGISSSGQYWAYSQIQAGGSSWLTIDDRQNGELISERHAGALALSWSPTEDKLAYISGEDAELNSFWGPLRLMDAQTGDVSILSSNLVLAFFWSPDGKKIATISLPFNFGLDGGIEVQGPKTRHLARLPAPLPIQRSNNSFNLSIIDIEDGSGLDLGEISLPTSYITQFLIFFDQYALSHHIWSPGSDAIVMPLIENNLVEITVVSAISGRGTKIGPGRIAFWSPR